MNYLDSISWLFSTQWFGVKLGLENSRHLLKQLLAYPKHGVKVVHVAGTNGKGSTCAMIDSILKATGRRSGLFTSPHLIDFRERIQVFGAQILEEDCARILTKLRSICEAMEPHPTFFEIALALAMRWFRETECEWIVLETGMGGRQDATTAVPADICGITPIGMDHAEWLGDTVEKIAREKAGIFLAGVPAVSSPQDPEAALTLEQEANERRAPLEWVREPLLGYHIALPGEHQSWNAALATQILHRAGLRMSPDIVRQGLGQVSFPGRFERIRGAILDGAHNPHAAATLVKTWKAQFGEQKAALIFSTSTGKDIRGLLEILHPLAARVLLCPLNSPRAIQMQKMAEFLPHNSPETTQHESFAAAWQEARASGLPILIAGSLFLVGEAKAYLSDSDFQPSEQ